MSLPNTGYAKTPDLAAVGAQGREHPLPPWLHIKRRGDVIVGRRVEARWRGREWEDMLVQLQGAGVTQRVAGAHHGGRHRTVIGMAGDALHVFGQDHLGPDLTQCRADGHVKIVAALRQAAIGEPEQAHMRDAEHGGRLAQLPLPPSGQVLLLDRSAPDLAGVAARRGDQGQFDALVGIARQRAAG